MDVNGQVQTLHIVRIYVLVIRFGVAGKEVFRCCQRTCVLGWVHTLRHSGSFCYDFLFSRPRTANTQFLMSYKIILSFYPAVRGELRVNLALLTVLEQLHELLSGMKHSQ